MRLLLLVNSSASSVTPRGRVLVQKALAGVHEVTVAETYRRGHATRLATAAAKSGVEIVVVLGGDGTLNEAANGLVGTDTVLAALPGGSTNVFARAIGLPNDPIKATAAVLEAVGAGRIERVGLSSVNGRYFLFHVGVGFDAAVVERVERRAELKRWAGHPMFILSAVTTWIRHYDRSRPRFAIRSLEGTIVDDAYFAILLNTNPYTFLGNRPLSLMPEATLERALGVVAFRTLTLPAMLWAVAAALTRGSLRHQRHLVYVTDLDEVTVEGYGPVPFQVDGDYLGEIEKLEFHFEPDALRLVRP